MIITATDIATILRNNSINSGNVVDWMETLERKPSSHLIEYGKAFSEIFRRN